MTEKKTTTKKTLTKIEALELLHQTSSGLVIGKNVDGGDKAFKYTSIERVVEFIHEKFANTGFFHSLGIYGVELYHNQCTEIVKDIEFSGDFPASSKGNPMNSEQLLMSQNSYMVKRALLLAYNLVSGDDPDENTIRLEEQQRQIEAHAKKKEQQETLYEKILERIETKELLDLQDDKICTTFRQTINQHVKDKKLSPDHRTKLLEFWQTRTSELAIGQTDSTHERENNKRPVE